MAIWIFFLKATDRIKKITGLKKIKINWQQKYPKNLTLLIQKNWELSSLKITLIKKWKKAENIFYTSFFSVFKTW